MSSSIFLLTSIQDINPFDGERICSAIQELCSRKNCQESNLISFTDDLLLDCRFSEGKDATNISVPKDLRYVDIEGNREISLSAAIGFYRNYKEPIFAVLAHSPDFNVDLSTTSCVEDLRHALGL